MTTREEQIINQIKNGEDYFSTYGNQKYKFQIILEGDFGLVTIGSDSKKFLKQIVKILSKEFSFYVAVAEYWKNDEWQDCGMGYESLINFSEWFQEYNFKMTKNK